MASGTFYPAASGDDGYWYSSTLRSSNDELYLTNYGGLTHAFVRFQNVTIPAGAVITSAFIRFTAYSSISVAGFKSLLYFNDADDAVAPTDTTEANALDLTTENAAWDFDTSWTDGTTYDTPSLIDALQEIVDRPGWGSGQAVMLVLKDNSSSMYRKASAYDYSSGAEKAELHVEWSSGVNVQANCPSLTLTPYAASIQADTHVQAACAALALTPHNASVFWGTVVSASPVSLILTPHAASIQADTSIAAACASLILTPHAALISYDIEILAAAMAFTLTPHNATIWDGAAWDRWISVHHHEISRLYYLTLTGDADGVNDLTLPMASFQARRRQGEPTFMAAVIPGISNYDAILARANGDLVIEMAYSLNGVIEYREELVRVDYENIRYHQGGRNQSLVVEGHKTESFTPKGMDLRGVTYKAIDNGLTRFRCAAPEMYVNPGDTARYDGDAITVAEMTLYVDPVLASMELAEEE